MHYGYKCPCGTEFGELTDHPQVEKLCPEHQGGSGWRNTRPEYAKGKEAPEKFDEFIVEEQQRREKEGRAMPAEFATEREQAAAPEPVPEAAAAVDGDTYDTEADEAEDREEEDTDAAAEKPKGKPRKKK
jgi:hypothetical protein